MTLSPQMGHLCNSFQKGKSLMGSRKLCCRCWWWGCLSPRASIGSQSLHMCGKSNLFRHSVQYVTAVHTRSHQTGLLAFASCDRAVHWLMFGLPAGMRHTLERWGATTLTGPSFLMSIPLLEKWEVNKCEHRYGFKCLYCIDEYDY